MNTPFYDALARAARRGPRFFMPGHKGNAAALPALAAALELDLTEVDGIDDLQAPTGALAQSQANMARAYGSGATLYAAGGASACIAAMLAVFVGPGGTVAMARGCHASAVRALALLGAAPHWVRPGADGKPQPADVDAALAASGAKAVFVTSVDYYGRMADIPALAAVCRRHGAVLLCDNAHGAYLRFLSPGIHPLSLGADAAADSAHKTLACLTGAAMLHLRDAARAEEGRAMLNLFSSTSPSQLVLASLDLAAGQLLACPPDFAACAARLAQTAAASCMAAPCDDPLRLRLRPALAGFSPVDFKEKLLALGIAAEYFDGDSLIFMAAPANTEMDFAALDAAIHSARQALPRRAAAPPLPPQPLPLPEVVYPLRQALFATNRRRVPTAQAVGRVAAGLAAPCPPGVPLVLPGERFSAPHTGALAAGGIMEMDVLL